MNLNELVKKANAFDEMFSQNQSPRTTSEDEFEKEAGAIIDKANAFDNMFPSSESQYSPEVQGLDKEAEFQLDQAADLVLQKAAAYDELMLEAQAESILEKAAAFDSWQSQPDPNDLSAQDEQVVQGYINKAAAYDQVMQARGQ